MVQIWQNNLYPPESKHGKSPDWSDEIDNVIIIIFTLLKLICLVNSVIWYLILLNIKLRFVWDQDYTFDITFGFVKFFLSIYYIWQ